MKHYKRPSTDTTGWDRAIMDTAPRSDEEAYWIDLDWPVPSAKALSRHVSRFGSEAIEALDGQAPGLRTPYKPVKRRRGKP